MLKNIKCDRVVPPFMQPYPGILSLGEEAGDWPLLCFVMVLSYLVVDMMYRLKHVMFLSVHICALRCLMHI